MKLIVACDPRGGIGYENKLPWSKIQGDLPRFKSLTDGNVIVMGRNTWESLPKKPLSGRLNFVITRQNLTLPWGAFSVSDINQFIDFKNCWLIGGAQLINSSWHLIDEIYLTKTLVEYKCDTWIDLSYIEDNFKCTHTENNEDHIFQKWQKK